MAKVTVKDLADALVANAANVATQASLTTANITAIGHLLQIMAERRADILPAMHYLSDTDSAQLYLNG